MPHGRPILLASPLAQVEGAGFVARRLVNSAGNVAGTRKTPLRAFEAQQRDAGSSCVEIETMCPTGRFTESEVAPGYLEDHPAVVRAPGVLKDEIGR